MFSRDSTFWHSAVFPQGVLLARSSPPRESGIGSFRRARSGRICRLVNKAGPTRSGQARLDFAGKRGGRPSPSQPDISARLIGLAQEGKRVLRLKGGDPCVFGRGGEEALALAASGVPFRIVPGITAGIGGLAYAGIPLTHRDTNSAVTFLTGHDSDGAVPGGLDWQAIARGAPVLVLYMAARHLPSIAERLMSGGRRPDEPVAVISKATTAAQRVVVSTLSEVVAAATGIETPSIVVVGEVVRFHKALDWGRRPRRPPGLVPTAD